MRGRRRGAAWAVSIALHLALALLWVRQTALMPHRSAAAPVPRSVVRLLPGSAKEVPSPATRSRPAASLAPPHRPQAPTPTPQAISLLPDAPGAAVTPPMAATPQALDLVLPARPAASAPRRSLLGQALDDPRSNSRRIPPSERFAANLGMNTERIEEHIADGVRIRQGKRCVLVHDSHAGALNPFNQSVLPSPKLGEACP